MISFMAEKKHIKTPQGERKLEEARRQIHSANRSALEAWHPQGIPDTHRVRMCTFLLMNGYC